MPTVPTIRRGVALTGVPSARQSASAPAEAFGAGVGEALGQAGQLAAQIAQKERIEVEEAQLAELDRNLKGIETELLFDSENGALNKQGRNAFGIEPTVLGEFDKRTGKFGMEIKSDRVRRAYEALVQKRREDINRSLERHVAAQSEAYKQHQYESSAEASIISGSQFYNDPERIAREQLRGSEMIRRLADKKGLDSDVAVLSYNSKFHSAIVDAALAGKDASYAVDYLERVGDQMTPVDRASAVKKVEVHRLRADGQANADRIMLAAESQAQALEQARAIEDPALRDETVDRVKTRWAEKKALEEEAEKQVMGELATMIENGGSTVEVEPGQWAALSPTQRNALAEYERKIRSGEDPVTDDDLYLEMELAAGRGESKRVEKLLRDNPHRLSRSDRRHFSSLLRTMDSGDDSEIVFLRTKNQTVDDVLLENGIENNPKTKADRQFVAQVRRTIDERVAAIQRASGKEATPEDYRRIAQEVVIKVERDRFGPNPEDFAIELEDQEIEEGKFVIPPDVRRGLVEGLQQDGHQPSEANVQRAYKNWLRRRIGR